MKAVILMDESKLGRDESSFNPSFSEPIGQFSLPNGHNSSCETTSSASGSVYQHSHSNSNPAEQNDDPVSRSDSFHSLHSQHTESSVNGLCSSERSTEALVATQSAQLIMSHPIDMSVPATRETNSHTDHSNSLGINIPQPQSLFKAPLSDSSGFAQSENWFKPRRSNCLNWQQPVSIPQSASGPLNKRAPNGTFPCRPYKPQWARGRGIDLHSPRTRTDFNNGCFRGNANGPFSGPGRPTYFARPQNPNPNFTRRSYGGQRPPSRFSSSSAHSYETHYSATNSNVNLKPPAQLNASVESTVCSITCATTPPSVDSAITSSNSQVEPRLSDEGPSSRCSVSTASCSSACSPFQSVLNDEQLLARFESLQRASASNVLLDGCGVEFTGCAADAIEAHLSQLKSLGLSSGADGEPSAAASGSSHLPALTFGFDETETQTETVPVSSAMAMPSTPDVAAAVAASPAANAGDVCSVDLTEQQQQQPSPADSLPPFDPYEGVRFLQQRMPLLPYCFPLEFSARVRRTPLSLLSE